MYIHIHNPPKEYVGQVRSKGCRRWTTKVQGCKTAEATMSKMIAGMDRYDFRARVLMCQGYYDPYVLMELKRAD